MHVNSLVLPKVVFNVVGEHIVTVTTVVMNFSVSEVRAADQCGGHCDKFNTHCYVFKNALK